MNIHILVGTTSGNTEYLARTTTRRANFARPSPLSFTINLIMQMFHNLTVFGILCIATHGAGEYADSIAPFMETLQREQPLLSALKFAIIAVGDSSYDTFAKLDEMPNRYFWS